MNDDSSFSDDSLGTIAYAFEKALPLGAQRPRAAVHMPRSQPVSSWPVVHPATLQDKPIPERRWCVPGWIPDRYVTLLTGDGGTGKSLLALQLATCAALGLPFFGIELAPRRVLYLSCEDDLDEMHRRQASINRQLAIDFADLDEKVFWRTCAGEDSLLYGPDKTGRRFGSRPLFDNLSRFCSDNGVQLLIVDTLADTFGGLEIDRQQVTRFIRLLQSVASKTDGAVLLLGHPSVSSLRDGAGISGSTAWRNAVRSVLHLRRPTAEEGATPGDRDVRLLEGLKGNYAPAGSEIRMRYFDGAFISQGEPADTSSQLDAVGMEVLISRALRDLLNNGVQPSPSNKSTDFAAKHLKAVDKLRRLTLDQIDAIIRRMVAKGDLRNAIVGTGKNRRQVIVPSDFPPLPDERDPVTGEKKTGGGAGGVL